MDSLRLFLGPMQLRFELMHDNQKLSRTDCNHWWFAYDCGSRSNELLKTTFTISSYYVLRRQPVLRRVHLESHDER